MQQYPSHHRQLLGRLRLLLFGITTLPVSSASQPKDPVVVLLLVLLVVVPGRVRRWRSVPHEATSYPTPSLGRHKVHRLLLVRGLLLLIMAALTAVLPLTELFAETTPILITARVLVLSLLLRGRPLRQE